MKRLRGMVWAMLLVGGSAWAGAKARYEVVVNALEQRASGALGSARNSADSVQYIGCSTYVDAGGAEVLCFARAANGAYTSCYSTGEDYIKAVQSIQPDSLIEFIGSEFGTCWSLTVTESSITEPKIR